jgi:integrase
MGKVNLPYVEGFRAKGRAYWYYRRDGQRIRLPGDPGSAEFTAVYERTHDSFERPATIGSARALPGSIAALVAAYKASAEFAQLGEKTRKDYARYLERFATDKGELPVGRMERRHVIAYRDKFSATPRTANYMVQVIRLVMEWGLDRGWLKVNPATRPKRLKTGDGHRPWEETEIDLFRDHWKPGTIERTAFEVALNTGQRGEDIAAMERAHMDAKGTIAVAQEKTDARVWVPQSKDLKRALDAWNAAQDRRMEALEKDGKPIRLAMRSMLLTTETGRAFKVDNFRHVMIAAYQAVKGLKVGLEAGGVTTHGLRYTAATILHELDCDWDTIAAITGHETVQMVRKYTEKKRKAKVAIARLDRARKNRGKRTNGE